MQKIGKLLNSNIKNHKIENKVKRYEIYRIWEVVLTKYLPEAANNTMITSFERGILQIAVLSKEVANDICVCQNRLCMELNTCMGKNLVYRIYCQS